MKHFIVTLTLMLSVTSLYGLEQVKFSINDGLSDQTLKRQIEQRVSSLLTEINRADSEKRTLRLGGIVMSPNAMKSLQMLWRSLHFSCYDNEIVQRCLTSINGYEIRRIDIAVHPVYAGYEGERDRELTLSLDRSGTITGVYMAVSSQAYDKILKDGQVLNDLDRRTTILNFVENFRSHYDEKDINALRQIYSDDALIITGRVVMKQGRGDMAQLKPEIIYNTQHKEEYLNRLEQNFKRNKYVKVTFSDPEVVRSGSNPDFYAVTVHQHWKSDNYEDDGYLVLLWEFREHADPIVHVRTWQPDHIGNKPLTKGDVFNINDFQIPRKKNKL